MEDFIQQNDRVLFMGDSVTDCGRGRPESGGSESDLGSGYPAIIAAWYSALHPEKCVTFFNRGISGNRVRDLRARWQKDCLDLHPTLVSILIGVNDTWRRFDNGDITSAEAFERDYRAILDPSRASGARLVLCEPFCLPVPDDRRGWRVDLDPRIHIVRRLAVEYQAALVPLDGIFAQAAARRDPAFWLPDGVHPTPAGHALLSQAWLSAVNS